MRRPHFLFASLLWALSTGVWAQAFPSKPIRLIVPYPAGGVVDTAARALGKKLGDVLGQAVIVGTNPVPMPPLVWPPWPSRRQMATPLA